MSVAHIDLLAAPLEHAEPRRASWRRGVLIGCAGAFALAAVPSVIALLLFTRSDLLLSY